MGKSRAELAAQRGVTLQSRGYGVSELKIDIKSSDLEGRKVSKWAKLAAQKGVTLQSHAHSVSVLKLNKGCGF